MDIERENGKRRLVSQQTKKNKGGKTTGPSKEKLDADNVVQFKLHPLVPPPRGLASDCSSIQLHERTSACLLSSPDASIKRGNVPSSTFEAHAPAVFGAAAAAEAAAAAGLLTVACEATFLESCSTDASSSPRSS